MRCAGEWEHLIPMLFPSLRTDTWKTTTLTLVSLNRRVAVAISFLIGLLGKPRVPAPSVPLKAEAAHRKRRFCSTLGEFVQC